MFWFLLPLLGVGLSGLAGAGIAAMIIDAFSENEVREAVKSEIKDTDGAWRMRLKSAPVRVTGEKIFKSTVQVGDAYGRVIGEVPMEAKSSRTTMRPMVWYDL